MPAENDAGSCGARARAQQSDDADSEHSKFMAAWAWKREHLPDKLRFRRPYRHPFEGNAQMGGLGQELVIHQSKFEHEGFASTGVGPCSIYESF